MNVRTLQYSMLALLTGGAMMPIVATPARALPQPVVTLTNSVQSTLPDAVQPQSKGLDLDLGVGSNPSLPEYMLYQSLDCETFLYSMMIGNTLFFDSLGTDLTTGLILTCGEEVDDILPGPDLTNQLVDEPEVGIPGVNIPGVPNVRRPRVPNPF